MVLLVIIWCEAIKLLESQSLIILSVRTRPSVQLWPERKIESQFSQFPGKRTAQVLVSGIIIKQELVLDNNLPENCPY